MFAIRWARIPVVTVSITYFVMAGTVLDGTETLRTGQESARPHEVPLPSYAVRLEKSFSFPDAESRGAGPYLSQPESMALGPDGLVCVADVLNNEVYLYDLAGRYVRTIGRPGQGPGEFVQPTRLSSTGGRIVVHEAGNRRFQFFDFAGKYVAGFRAFRGYRSFSSINDRIYAAPTLTAQLLGTDRGYLVDILDLEGRWLGAFGTPLSVGTDHVPWLDEVLLSPSPEKELWLAFKCFPIVRKFSRDGKLIGEYRYSNRIADTKEAMNKKTSGETSSPLGYYPYQFITQGVYATSEGLYMIDCLVEHRLLIAFMGNNGRVSEYYWAPIELRGFYCGGLFVLENQGAKKFYILNGGDNCVDVYAAKQ